MTSAAHMRGSEHIVDIWKKPVLQKRGWRGKFGSNRVQMTSEPLQWDLGGHKWVGQLDLGTHSAFWERVAPKGALKEGPGGEREPRERGAQKPSAGGQPGPPPRRRGDHVQ